MDPKEVKENFKNWINSVPNGDYDRVRKLIISECYITKYVFRDWKLQRTCPPPLAQKKINEIAKREFNQTVFDYE